MMGLAQLRSRTFSAKLLSGHLKQRSKPTQHRDQHHSLLLIPRTLNLQHAHQRKCSALRHTMDNDQMVRRPNHRTCCQKVRPPRPYRDLHRTTGSSTRNAIAPPCTMRQARTVSFSSNVSSCLGWVVQALGGPPSELVWSE